MIVRSNLCYTNPTTYGNRNYLDSSDEATSMRVLQLRTWITNIGNGFIDKGAKMCIEKAISNPEITEVSGLGQKASYQTGLPFLKEYVLDIFGRGHNIQSYAPKKSPSFSISEHLDFDVAILAGCVLDRHLEWYEPILQEISDRNIPIILLGVGGLSYDEKTKSRIQETLSKLNIQGMITRDDDAYRCYSDYVEHAYRGIDCAFFINDWYNPPDSLEEFIASTFDKDSEPPYETDLKIVRPYHKSLSTPMSGLTTVVGEIMIQRLRQHRVNFFNKNNILVSDLLEDYLFVYKNSVETHSDRVHACVPSLVYGNRAKLHIDTPRSGLFDRVLKQDITNEVVEVDQDRLSKAKTEQVENLSKIISNIS